MLCRLLGNASKLIELLLLLLRLLPLRLRRSGLSTPDSHAS
jgi:hypothetical protein